MGVRLSPRPGLKPGPDNPELRSRWHIGNHLHLNGAIVSIRDILRPVFFESVVEIPHDYLLFRFLMKSLRMDIFSMTLGALNLIA